MKNRVISAVLAGLLGGLMSVGVWFYGNLKAARHIKNPYSGNIFVFILLGIAMGVMIVVFWHLSEEEKKK